MSHFYGTLQGNRGGTTRCGTKSSGIITYAAGWEGAICTRVFQGKQHGYGEGSNDDWYIVELVPWEGSGGTTHLIGEGRLNAGIPPRRPANKSCLGFKHCYEQLRQEKAARR